MAEPFLYHWFPDEADELSTTLPPEQKVLGVVVVIEGAPGKAFTVIVRVSVNARLQVPLLTFVKFKVALAVTFGTVTVAVPPAIVTVPKDAPV